VAFEGDVRASVSR